MSTVSIHSENGRTRLLGPDGEDLSDRVTGITFRADASMSYAEIDLAFIEVNAIDTPVRMLGPRGKEVRRIEYADGTVDVFEEQCEVE